MFEWMGVCFMYMCVLFCMSLFHDQFSWKEMKMTDEWVRTDHMIIHCLKVKEKGKKILCQGFQLSVYR